jgi:hypothetical protein
MTVSLQGTRLGTVLSLDFKLFFRSWNFMARFPTRLGSPPSYLMVNDVVPRSKRLMSGAGVARMLAAKDKRMVEMKRMPGEFEKLWIWDGE